MQLKIDESFAEKQIPANDSVRLLDKIVEEMDLSALMRAYNSLGRKPATPPRIMLKILLYAGMEHNYASRKIHAACQLGVEGEYITGVDVSSERNDQLTLIPLMEKMCG